MDTRLKEAANADLQRDPWMQAPSSLDVDYVQRKKKEKSTYIRATQADHQMKMHQAESNHHLRDIQDNEPEVEEEPAQRLIIHLGIQGLNGA